MGDRLRILIVGGVAGGASAAAKARRVNESAEIHVFERGPYISFANCGLPYFISGEIKSRDLLVVMTPERFQQRSAIHTHVGHEVLSINRARKVIVVRGPEGAERQESYDKLVLSQGARPFVPNIPGVDLPHVFTLRDIPDMDRIASALEKNKIERVVVIGGGFIGLEMAEAFVHRGLQGHFGGEKSPCAPADGFGHGETPARGHQTGQACLPFQCRCVCIHRKCRSV